MHIALPIERASFSGHESFPLRFGWLKKAHDAIGRDPGFLSRADALIALGVGKNMVRSMRHWCLATGTAEESDGSGSSAGLAPTEFGRALLDDDGWDPYLEDMGTVWWLHWQVVTNTQRATTWSWVFSRPQGNRFAKAVVVAELEALAHDNGRRKASKASLKRDLDVLLRSYAPGRAGKGKRTTLEDTLDSPFGLLQLVRPAVERDEYEMPIGEQRTLPDAVFEAAVLDYVDLRHATGQTVSIDELLFAPHAPGRVFRLSPDALSERLYHLVRAKPEYRLHETAGLRQLVVPETPATWLSVLAEHYSAWAGRAAA